jgi:hypothetical protein
VEREKILTVANDVRAALIPLMRAWLQAAPRFRGAISDLGQILPVEQAVEQFTLAALERQYYSLMEAHADFQIMEFADYDPLNLPPPTYRRVVRKIGYHYGLEVELQGSVYRLDRYRVYIDWE